MVATTKKITIKVRMFNAERAAARLPLQELAPLEVVVPFNDTHDTIRQRVEEHVRTRTGRKVRSISACVGGGFVATIDPN